MSTEQSGGSARSKVPVEVAVDWEALEDAFENNAPELHSAVAAYLPDFTFVLDDLWGREAAWVAEQLMEPAMVHQRIDRLESILAAREEGPFTSLFGFLERRFGVPLVDGGTQRLPRFLAHAPAVGPARSGQGRRRSG